MYLNATNNVFGLYIDWVGDYRYMASLSSLKRVLILLDCSPYLQDYSSSFRICVI